MKKIRIILCLCCVIILNLFVLSCTKNDDVVPQAQEIDVAKMLRFIDVTANTGKDSNVARITDPFTIVTWDEWGRASKKCAGWGLCNADWFPGWKTSTRPISKNGGAAILEFDQTVNKYFIDLLLAEQAPSSIPAESFTLFIDIDFTLNVTSVVGRDLIFAAGKYNLDNSLGDFGGYRIYLN